MVSFDVTALFTSVRTPRRLHSAHQRNTSGDLVYQRGGRSGGNSCAGCQDYEEGRYRSLSFLVWVWVVNRPIPITTFSSIAILQHKLGVIRTLLHRISTICSNHDEQALELQHLKRVLSVSGYTKKAWRTASRARPRNASSSTQPPEKVMKGVSPSPMSDRLQRRVPTSFMTGA